MSETTAQAEFPLVLGLDTFGDLIHDDDGRPLSHAETIRSVVEQGVLADQVGVDFFGIGEHHTGDFPMPAADVVLAAIAARTTRIHLGSAVTVLSSDDPVRVFQRYSTLNAISGGRAEVILGRGSSIESFPLFGYDLADYERLFEEKTDLFAELVKGGPRHLGGHDPRRRCTTRTSSRISSRPLPVWIGVGGSPESVVRAARYGFSLMLAIIGGPPARFAPFSQLFRRSARRARSACAAGRHPRARPRRRDRRAGRARVLAALARRRSRRIGRERGFRPPTEESFAYDVGPRRRPLRRRRPRPSRRRSSRTSRNLGGRPLRPQVRHARPHPRPAHDDDRALRHPGHPAGARAARPRARELARSATRGAAAHRVAGANSVHPFVTTVAFRVPPEHCRPVQRPREALMGTIEVGTEIRPFDVDFPQADLDDLRRRIQATRWPEKETVADATQGVQLATMQELARYWGTEYDFGQVRGEAERAARSS